jgi:hypothetical protein
VHCPDGRPDRLDLVEHLGRGDVARVEEQVGGADPLDAAVREAAVAAWQVGVRDDRDHHAQQGTGRSE